nr:uncharacterized protein LOC109153119 isoform X1 [Ipomoea trifida]
MESLVDLEGKPGGGRREHGELRNIDEQEASSTFEDSHTTESKKTEWTNEKHSLYLSSMETSFVNQLYDSLDSFGWNSGESNPKSSRQKHSASGQFKVFRDGSWTRIDVKRDEPRLNRKEESGLFLASPWIKRYRPHRHHNGTSQNQSQLPLHQDSIDSIAEVTDQNFVDEDLEAKPSQKRQGMKRVKTSLVSESSNDQVVPFGDNAEVHGCKPQVIGNHQ